MKNANISVTLPQASLDYLDSVCEKNDLKRSQVVELLITAQKLAEDKGETLLPIYKVSMPDVNRTLTPEDIKELEKKGYTVEPLAFRVFAKDSTHPDAPQDV